MRLDVSIYGTLLAGLTGLVAGEEVVAAAAAAESDAGISRVTTTTTPTTTAGDGTSMATASSNSVLQINPFPTPAIFMPSSHNVSIGFSKGDNITDFEVRAVYLKRYTDDYVIGKGEITDEVNSDATTSTRDVIARRQTVPVPLPPFQFTVFQSAVELPLGDLSYYGSNINQVLYYEFQWQDSTTSGKSYTQVIAVATTDSYDEAAANLADTGLGNSPAHQEDTGESSAATVSATASASPTSTATNEGGEVFRAGATTPLTRSAIIGIAVACVVVGLALIALFVWFCLLRRRSRRRANNGERSRDGQFASDPGAHHMMADKEAAVVTNMSESFPNLGYHNNDEEAAAQTQSRDPYPQNRNSTRSMGPVSIDDDPPYSDRSPSPSSPPPLRRSVPVFPSDSQGDVSTRSQSHYAHLIEEGMTEDEIQRLEEEERHLDQAIEQQGRSSGRMARPE